MGLYNVLLIIMQVLQPNQKANSVRLKDGSYEDRQPSHYEFDAFDDSASPKAKLKTRSAGEFEMPVMDNYDLHSPTSQKTHTKEESPKKDMEKYLQMGVHVANGFNIFSSGVTAIGSAVSKNDKTINFLQSFASFGAKLSMGINSMFNILNGHKQKDLANVVGYAGELLAAMFAPYKVLGLIRGMTFSTYQTSNILATEKPMEESKTYGDYLSQLKDRYPKLIKKLFQAKTYTNIKDNLGVLTGGWGGLLSLTGVFGWAMTGSTKFGGWVKGLGEVLVDSYQVVTKEHWDCGRQFYIGSGLAFIMGSLCEIISKQRNNDPVTMALYFFGSGIGRLLYTISNILGENKYGPKPVEADAKPNIFDISKILNFNKAQAAAA